MAAPVAVTAGLTGEEADGPIRAGKFTTSMSVIEPEIGTHRFEIKGYSLLKGLGCRKFIASDVFSVGGHDWKVYFYPDGMNPDDDPINVTYVSLFVGLVSDWSSDIRVMFEMTLLDQSGKGNHKVRRHFDGNLSRRPYTIKSDESMWGSSMFIQRSILEDSGFIKDDGLVILCTVKVVKYRTYVPTLREIPVPQSQLSDSFKCLFESQTFCDIAIVVGDETFKAHKLVLSCRSPVFKAHFFGPMSDPNLSEIVVEDILPSTFKGMLHYIYTDTLPDFGDTMDGPSLFTSTVKIEYLLAAANSYDLDRLKLMCESKLSEEINQNTVATILALAERYHCVQLKNICLKFVSDIENLKAVLQTESLEQLESNPSLLSNIAKAGVKSGSVRSRTRTVNSGESGQTRRRRSTMVQHNALSGVQTRSMHRASSGVQTRSRS